MEKGKNSRSQSVIVYGVLVGAAATGDVAAFSCIHIACTAKHICFTFVYVTMSRISYIRVIRKVLPKNCLLISNMPVHANAVAIAGYTTAVVSANEIEALKWFTYVSNADWLAFGSARSVFEIMSSLGRQKCELTSDQRCCNRCVDIHAL